MQSMKLGSHVYVHSDYKRNFVSNEHSSQFIDYSRGLFDDNEKELKTVDKLHGKYRHNIKDPYT
jgi:hypothetical protein